jgi:hypothetical protein
MSCETERPWAQCDRFGQIHCLECHHIYCPSLIAFWGQVFCPQCKALNHDPQGIIGHEKKGG